MAASEDSNSIWAGRSISPVGNTAQDVAKNGEAINEAASAIMAMG